MKLDMNNPEDGFPMAFVDASSKLGRYLSTKEDAQRLSAIIPLSDYPRILDVCCGFGRFTKEIRQLGYQVTGLDLSKEQIDRAKEDDPGGHYIQGDMRKTPALNYDAVINMYTSFGYFEEENDDLTALSAWCKSLRRGGVLIMELADMDRARTRLSRLNEKIYRVTGDVTEEIRMDWDSRIFEVTFLQGDGRFTCYTRLYEKESLRDHLLKAGFSNVDFYGALDRKTKEPGDNLVLVARK